MSAEFRCGKCGSENIRVYQDGSGFCLVCKDTFEDVNKRSLETTVKSVKTEVATHELIETEQFRHEFNYSLTITDAEKFVAHYLRKHPFLKHNRAIIGIAFLITLSTLIIFHPLVTSDTRICVITVWLPLIVLESMILTNVFGKIKIKMNSRNLLIDSPQTVIINKTSLFQTSEFGEFTLPWSAFEYILSDDNSVYLYLYSRNCVVIPRRLFKGQTESELFIQRAKEALEIGKAQNEQSFQGKILGKLLQRSGTTLYFEGAVIYVSGLFFLSTSAILLSLAPFIYHFQALTLFTSIITILGLILLRNNLHAVKLLTAGTFLLVLSFYGGVLGFFLLSYLGALLALPALIASICVFIRRKYGWVVLASLFSIVLGFVLSILTFYFLLMALVTPLLLYKSEDYFKD